ncbi:hypothetical protein [Pseudoalteromonas sp. SR41-4]|uniref:hypothetical protein n=1 Tax=Pseudoalteromonas sp. SR41-4 TaxID=2760950 RepID=UPI001600D962|nr:hypothetical protein [Pseudoalteromonas sp. SR41-4]MBB1294593.1 hypothetical protein [Pseudoalteromonas sp. SR41-4]
MNYSQRGLEALRFRVINVGWFERSETQRKSPNQLASIFCMNGCLACAMSGHCELTTNVGVIDLL